MKNKQQSVAYATITLLLANFLTKIIGALFKIPLANAIGKDGMGLFSVAYQIYTFVFIIATSGFPVAISKMVSEESSKKNSDISRDILKVSCYTLGVFGLVQSVLLYVFSGNIANFIGNQDSALGIKLIAPALFFISIVGAYRGYFQGKQNMIPTAVSEVIEATSKLGIGLWLTYKIKNAMMSTEGVKNINFFLKKLGRFSDSSILISSGPLIGVTVGTILAFFYLIIRYLISVADKKIKVKNYSILDRKKKARILKQIILTATPIMIGASVSILTSVIDLTTIMKRLAVNPKVFETYSHLFKKGTKFFNETAKLQLTQTELYYKKANYLYGMYNGYAIPMFNLPLTIVVAIAMCIVPAVSGEIAKNRQDSARKISENSLKMTSIFSIPMAIGMCVLAKPILCVVYMGDYDAYKILQKLSIAIIFVSLVSVTSAVLQAFGRLYFPVYSMLIGGTVKVLCNYFLIPIMGIDAAPISTLLCYGVISILNLIFIFKYTKSRFKIFDFFSSIFFSVLASLPTIKLHNYLTNSVSFFKINSLFSQSLTLMTSILFFGIIYFCGIIFTKTLKTEDIKYLLPKSVKNFN